MAQFAAETMGTLTNVGQSSVQVLSSNAFSAVVAVVAWSMS